MGRYKNHSYHPVDEKKARELLQRYRNGQCSDEEQAVVEKWIEQQLEGQSWDIDKKEKEHFGRSLKSRIDRDRLARVDTDLPQPGKYRQLNVWRRIAAAVIFIIGLSTALFFYHGKLNQQPLVQKDIVPGGNKAILTLANGRQIILTNAKNGALASEGSAQITKKADGSVVYNVKVTSDATASGYNLIRTPRGGQYQVTLADGTKVWLNSSSSLKYPSLFAGNERRVELTGEAYFEVAHNKLVPFKVIAAAQEVKVLGTHFNINAYTDEPVLKTTLLQGSVSVMAGAQNALLKPGQQAVLAQNTISVKSADTEEAIAWKNGMFQFSEESLESIMRKISRWYDVDVEYADNKVKGLPLTGVITHFSNISRVLRMLELTRQVHFKIEGKKIIVTK